jgi:predicted DNA-binding protein YlxM (UPF0122 family)
MGKMRIDVLNRNTIIRNRYDKEIKNNGNNVEAAISKIAAETGIGKFYVRSILKDQGVDIRIKSMLRSGSSIQEISAKHGITETRVRQLTKGIINKDYTKEIKDIRKMVRGGSTYDKIVSKYGRDRLRAIKTKGKFNVYQEVLRNQNSAIVKLFNKKVAPLDIAEKFGLTRDSIYGILKKNGLTSRISKEEKLKRDSEIKKLFEEGVALKDIASRYSLTTTMVGIITNKKS